MQPDLYTLFHLTFNILRDSDLRMETISENKILSWTYNHVIQLICIFQKALKIFPQEILLWERETFLMLKALWRVHVHSHFSPTQDLSFYDVREVKGKRAEGKCCQRLSWWKCFNYRLTFNVKICIHLFSGRRALNYSTFNLNHQEKKKHLHNLWTHSNSINCFKNFSIHSTELTCPSSPFHFSFLFFWEPVLCNILANLHKWK